jgi:MFS transporter, PPP family, 3-phenylpropionic acid transporter
MSPPDRAEGFSPELRASIFHFTVFGSTGAASAYFAIWLSGKGIAPDQIGIINAVPVLVLLFASMLIGRLADKASDWRVMIIALAVIAGAASLGFLFVNEFWGALLVFTLCYTPAGAMVPVLDAATLRMTERRGTDFGFVRAWGTVGYTITAALTGALIGWLGAIVFVPLFIALSLMRTGLAFQLPRFRAPEHVAAPTKTSGGPKLSSLLRPWFILPCIAFALIQSTHFFLGAMGALVWKLDGIGEGWVGPLIAVSAAGEAITMFFWRRIGTRMTARTMLIIAGVVGTVRFLAMAFSPSLPILFLLQALHAITLPFSYFGIMHFIANWAPEDIAAEAQSFSSMLMQGFAVVTLLLFGWLVGVMGAGAYFVASGMALVAALLALWSLALRPSHSRHELAHA